MVSNEDIDNFLSISGCTDPGIARSYLEMYPGDMNSAINEYFSNLGNESTHARNNEFPRGDLSHGEDDVRTPIPSFSDQLIPDDHGILAPSQFMRSARMSETTGDMASPADDFSSNMFSPPESIMFCDSFEAAKERAKSQKKLIFVNIQSPQEFSSMILNRDIWNDSLIIEFIHENFIFWQRSCSTPDGAEWMTLYNVSKLPHVSVVDPRTGRQLKVWDVAKSFSDSISASSEIIEFLEAETTLRALNRMSSTSNSLGSDPGVADTATNATSLSSDLISNPSQTTPGGLPSQGSVLSQPSGQIQVPKINSELAMLHMERMKRKNSEKK